MITDLELRIRIILKAFELAVLLQEPPIQLENIPDYKTYQVMRDNRQFCIRYDAERLADEIADAIATWTELGIDLEES